MTLYEFLRLDEQYKYQTTWDIGSHIDTVINNEKRILLYSIAKFFVEVHYDAETNTIVDIKAFKHGHNLDKYSNNINFEDYL